MRDHQPLPQPGHLFGWGIVFGERNQHRCTIANDGLHDRAYAERRAAELHGIVFDLEVSEAPPSRPGAL